ncbi:serine hydrolase domain-containing protein [Hymenobacter koreensis]
MKTPHFSVRSLVAGALLLAAGACGRTVAPKQQAAVPTAVPALNVALNQLHQRGQFSGAALVAEKGRVVYQQAFGFANVVNRQELRSDAQFDVSALNQTFTAAAVLSLRDQGELRLDDALSQYVPNLPYPGVTLRHLLTHTSGVPEADVRESGNDVAAELYYLHRTPAFAPGTQWQYTTTNYALLQKVVEKVTGMSYADYLTQAVFGPLNMRDTRVLRADRGTAPTPGMVGYERPSYLAPTGAPAEVSFADPRIYSTLNDLHAWVQGLRSGQLLAPASVKELFAPVRLRNGSFPETQLNGQRAAFGMGWFLSQPATGQHVAWHSGGQDGYFAYLGFDLTADRVVILLNNTEDAPGTLATAALMQSTLHGQPVDLPKRSMARTMGRLVATQGIEAAVLHYASVHTDTARYYASAFEFEQLSHELQARQQPAAALVVLSAFAATAAQASHEVLAPLQQLRARLVTAPRQLPRRIPQVVEI